MKMPCPKIRPQQRLDACRNLLLLLFSLWLLQSVNAQVGIQTDTPDGSAVLDIVSSNKGLLIPRLTLTNDLANPSPVSAPATGLLIYNAGANQPTGFYFWTGSEWKMLKPQETTDVQGPASSTDHAVARFDGTTGNKLQNSVVILDDNGNMSGVNSLTTAAFTMPTGAASGKVLVSDASGNASWDIALPLDVKENNVLVAPNISTINFRGAVDVTNDGNNQASVTISTTLAEEQVIQVGSTSSINVNTLTPTAVPWDVELFKDVASFVHSNTVNPSRIQVVIGGTYEINYMFSLVNDNNQRKTLRSRLRLNGTNYVPRSACYAFTYSSSDDKATLVSSSFLVDMNAGDYLEIMVNQQTNTGNVNLVPNENLLFVRIMRSW
ncbi:MAG: hypothetical protein KGZ82_09860 [Bacteroidales bacterium]|nr:hypothetical protein [Bacteroidales bacterium]